MYFLCNPYKVNGLAAAKKGCLGKDCACLLSNRVITEKEDKRNETEQAISRIGWYEG